MRAALEAYVRDEAEHAASPREASEVDRASPDVRPLIQRVPVLPLSHALQDAADEAAALSARAVSEAGSLFSVTDDARSEVSACDSEASGYSGTGSVRSLISNFSEASGISRASSTNMSNLSHATTMLASGGSRANAERAEKEAARRERAERRALREGKGNSRASTRDANTDKENKTNGFLQKASARVRSAAGLHAKGPARFDLSSAPPPSVATGMSVGFMAAGGNVRAKLALKKSASSDLPRPYLTDLLADLPPPSPLQPPPPHQGYLSKLLERVSP